jgi:hypothetical protein
MSDQKGKELSGKIGSAEIDESALQRHLQEIRDNQNLAAGFLGGIVAAIMGAIIWAMITAEKDRQFVWMAIGVGFLVGSAVRRFGKGIDRSFGILGAALSLLGCLVGNLFSACIIISYHEGMNLLEVLSRLNPQIVLELMKVIFSPIDLLFYGIAIYVGYRFSRRTITNEELAKMVKQN